jgi:hypothetical protein
MLKIGSAIIATVRGRARPLGQHRHRRNHLPVGLGPLITLVVGVPANASASVCASQVDKDQIHKGFNHTLLCIFMYTFFKIFNSLGPLTAVLIPSSSSLYFPSKGFQMRAFIY